MKTFLKACLLLLLFGMAGCTSAQSNEARANNDAVPADNPSLTEDLDPRIILESDEVSAGSVLRLSYSVPIERGGYYDLSRWDGTSWDSPMYLMESDANPEGKQPSWTKLEGQLLVFDEYLVSGDGPDSVVLPNPLASGMWRICLANVPMTLCAEIRVV